MKIGFVHSDFEHTAVTRVALDNLRGLSELYPDNSYVVIGSSFADDIPEYLEKRDARLLDGDFAYSDLRNACKDLDVVLIENPVVGTVAPESTMAYKKFAEENPGRVFYRVHDLLEDRPEAHEEFLRVNGTLEDIYPAGITYFSLTSFDGDRLRAKGLENVFVIPNPIVCDDFYRDEERGAVLRSKLEREGVVDSSLSIFTYPVRIVERKNIEEAVLLSALLSDEGNPHNLLVTRPADNSYLKKLEGLVREFNLPVSLGKAYDILKQGNGHGFTISDLFSISDFVVSTSVLEGFGYAFLEPWLCGIPMVGRDLRNITSDFKDNGIDLSHLYSQDELAMSPDSPERLEKVRRILKDKGLRRDIGLSLGISERISSGVEKVEQNREAVKFYDYLNSAKRLGEFFGL